MRRMRRKWESQSGASILLALLFLLVCMMVSASVLMAAASNAGKIRSNYEEQQRYLALSSALRLVAGQIAEAEYTGGYTVQRWVVPIFDEEGIRIGETKYYHVRQTAGGLTCGELGGALDLTKALDGVYAREFTGPGRTALSGDETAPLPFESGLKVTVDGEDAVKEKFPEVTVKAVLRTDLRIRLSAELKEGGGRSYRMEAELTASGLPALGFVPDGDEFAGDASMPGKEGFSEQAREDLPGGGAAPDVTWELDWIAKEVAGG